MRKTNIVLRILCSCIDLIVCMVPVQFIALGILQANPIHVNSLFLFLMAVYGTICCEVTEGMTLGKYFGKLRVLDKEGYKPSLMHVGLRELVKAMYLQTIAGPILAIISLILYFTKGTTLHDMIAGTRVVYQKQAQRIKEEQYYEQ